MAASGVYTPNLAGCNAEWRNIFSDLISDYEWPESLSLIIDKLSKGLQLDVSDGLTLYNLPEIDALGHLAHLSKEARFGKKAFFNMNVHINQTNICTLACKFCAFRRGRRAEDAYAVEIDDYIADLANYAPYVDEVHSVGGLHPDWDIGHYEKLFKAVREQYPHIHIKSLTAVEIKHISKLSNLSFLQTLSRLKEAGLGSLPGGGAEILDDDVREIICKGKESSEEYLEIHRTAHIIGIPTNCTMLFGTIESLEQRLNHMIKLRQLQTETSGFQCFVPYPFLPDDSRLPNAQLASGSEILRTIAISRLMIDNIPHLKAYRMNIGDHLAEMALQYGADDIDGTVQKESIMHLAGSTTPLDLDKVGLAKLVTNSGSVPVLRNTIYSKFENYEPPVIANARKLKMAAR
tara:strand:+ start:1887 stop:3101 length:1215 start_codon:yes stop_codon:yes gene_type:complete